MQRSNVPRFFFNCANPNGKNYKCIEVRGGVIHTIIDVAEFYEALGYKREFAKDGLLPEEFIWNEYIRDNSVKHDKCLQANIFKYLTKKSSAFIEKYGEQFFDQKEVCQSEKLADGSCDGCVFNPVSSLTPA